MRRTLFLAVGLSALAAGVRPAGAGDASGPLLARMGDEKDPGHAAAIEAWGRLKPAERVALVREGLAAAAPDGTPVDALVAKTAAALADWSWLDLGELRRQAAI